MVYYLTMKKKEILPFVTKKMNFDGIMLSEINYIKKLWYDFTYMCNKKKKKQNKQTKNLIETEISGWQRWEAGGKGVRGNLGEGC